MKAVIIEKFGGPEVMKFAEVPTPAPGPTEILIEVAYAGVNPVDWKIREGKLAGALPHDFPLILGWDAAGVVRARGSEVTAFQEGDRVFAYCRKPVVKMGTYAEYVTVEAAVAAPVPENLDFGSAAAVPLVALTAWQALFDFADLKAGEKVLVTAASGGVGGYAVQFAKNAGAFVYGTSGPRNQGYIKELGVDVPIDYVSNSFGSEILSRESAGVDVVFDCVGGETLAASYGLLRKGGRLVSIVQAPDAQKAAALGIRAGYHFVSPNGLQLRLISEALASGKVRVLPHEELPLTEVVKAHGQSEGRHQRGKISLKVKGEL